MVHPDAAASAIVRLVYAIDPQKKMRLAISCPPSSGRDIPEIFRTTDSLQLTDRSKPAGSFDRRDGGDVINAPGRANKAEIAKFLAKGYTEITP